MKEVVVVVVALVVVVVVVIVVVVVVIVIVIVIVAAAAAGVVVVVVVVVAVVVAAVVVVVVVAEVVVAVYLLSRSCGSSTTSVNENIAVARLCACLQTLGEFPGSRFAKQEDSVSDINDGWDRQSAAKVDGWLVSAAHSPRLKFCRRLDNVDQASAKA